MLLEGDLKTIHHEAQYLESSDRRQWRIITASLLPFYNIIFKSTPLFTSCQLGCLEEHLISLQKNILCYNKKFFKLHLSYAYRIPTFCWLTIDSVDHPLYWEIPGVVLLGKKKKKAIGINIYKSFKKKKKKITLRIPNQWITVSFYIS